jgi:hypothetical protein
LRNFPSTFVNDNALFSAILGGSTKYFVADLCPATVDLQVEEGQSKCTCQIFELGANATPQQQGLEVQCGELNLPKNPAGSVVILARFCNSDIRN